MNWLVWPRYCCAHGGRLHASPVGRNGHFAQFNGGVGAPGLITHGDAGQVLCAGFRNGRAHHKLQFGQSVTLRQLLPISSCTVYTWEKPCLGHFPTLLQVLRGVKLPDCVPRNFGRIRKAEQLQIFG